MHSGEWWVPRVLSCLFSVQCGLSDSLCSYGLTGSHCREHPDSRVITVITWCNAVPVSSLLQSSSVPQHPNGETPALFGHVQSLVGQNMIAAAASVWTNPPHQATFHHIWCSMMFLVLWCKQPSMSYNWLAIILMQGLSNIEFKNYRLATPVIRLLFRRVTVTRQDCSYRQMSGFLGPGAWQCWVFQTDQKYNRLLLSPDNSGWLFTDQITHCNTWHNPFRGNFQNILTFQK